jgi:hypothetical protein
MSSTKNLVRERERERRERSDDEVVKVSLV